MKRIRYKSWSIRLVIGNDCEATSIVFFTGIYRYLSANLAYYYSCLPPKRFAPSPILCRVIKVSDAFRKPSHCTILIFPTHHLFAPHKLARCLRRTLEQLPNSTNIDTSLIQATCIPCGEAISPSAILSMAIFVDDLSWDNSTIRLSVWSATQIGWSRPNLID